MQNANIIQDLVQVSRDGLEFYEAAMTEVKSPQLKEVFTRMASHKRTLIAGLSSTLAVNDEQVPTDGTFVGSVRKTYADLRLALSSNEDKTYVAQLEDSEDRLLKHFEEALADSEDASVKGLIQQHFPQVRACHDEMRRLKLRLAA